MSQKNDNDHKIWVDVQVEWNRLLQAMVDSEAINNYILQQAIRMLELTLQWALKSIQIYMTNEEIKWITDQVHIEVMILEDSQRVDVWCSQFDQVWCHTKDALITQKELKNQLNQQRIIHHNRCKRFSNNQKWAYQSISHEIMKYRYWMTSSQSECCYT
jgi:hypothetical protein